MTPSSILTFTGKFLDYLNPSIAQISIEDIAIALSREARFSGHTKEFYSVAQHSIYVSRLVPPAFAMEALLHDGTEAYCKDIPTPLKRLLPDYQKIERAVDLVIRKKFKLPSTMSQEVADGDHIALFHEMANFTRHNVDGLNGTAPVLTPLSSEDARAEFLARFKELRTLRGETNGKNKA